MANTELLAEQLISLLVEEFIDVEGTVYDNACSFDKLNQELGLDWYIDLMYLFDHGHFAFAKSKDGVEFVYDTFVYDTLC